MSIVSGVPRGNILFNDWYYRQCRLCADYKININYLLLDDHCPNPNIEEIFTSSMIGGKYFSKIDMRPASMHMPVFEKNFILESITTQKGCNYKVNRLMFGIKNASAI